MKAVPFIAIFAIGGLVGMFAMNAMVSLDTPTERRESFPDQGVPVPASADEENSGEPVPASAEVTDLEEQDLLVRAIQAVDPVDIGDRTGRIHGRVTFHDGTPLAGVAVTAAPGARPDREDSETMEGKVRRFIRDEQWRSGLESKSTTGSEGSYLLEGIGDLDYRVSAKLAGYRFESRSRRAIRPGDEVNFTAVPVAQIEVTVVRADGTEPALANVQVSRGNGSSRHQWNAKERVIDVEPGLLRVSASITEGERSEQVDITAETGSAPVPVRLILRSRGSIRGDLILPPDELETNMTVYLLSTVLKPDASAEDLLSAEQKTWTSRGRGFTFEDLDPGSYWIGAARGHEHQRQLPTIEIVEVAEAPVDVYIEVPPISTESGVLVYIYGPSGSLLSDAQVNFGIVSGNGSSWGGGMSTQLRDGGILLVADENIENAERNQPASRRFVSSQHGVYGESRATVGSFRGERVEIRYQDPASAIVTVAGYAGSAAVGKLQIQLRPDDESKEQHHYFRHDQKGIDANGEIRLGPFVPGPHVLQMQYVDRTGGYWSQNVLAEQSVHLVTGENRFTLAVPPLYTLEVVFPDADSNGSIQVQRDDPSGSSGSRHQSYEGGFAKVDGLLAGRYRVQAWGSGTKNGTAFVEVPAGSPLHFEPAPVNALRIQVTDETGPLAEAGFQSGDMIVKINGQPFEGEEQLAIMGAFLQGASEVKITVDRGGEELEFTVDPRKLMGANPGGQVDPTVR